MIKTVGLTIIIIQSFPPITKRDFVIITVRLLDSWTNSLTLR